MKTKLHKKKMIVTHMIIATLLLSCVPRVLATSWSGPRPPGDIIFDQRIDNAATDGKVSVGLGVHIWKYENECKPGVDRLNLRVAATANARAGITYGVERTLDGQWFDAPEETGITGDDNGTWFDLPFDVSFYGG